MKVNILAFTLILTATILSACATPVDQPAPTQSVPSGGGQPGQPDVIAPAWDQTGKIDEQGAVSVEVLPLNLNRQGETLEFEVALNTHSVDLSMDLAALAELSTDTGVIVQAATWDAPRGGHHVSGKLAFPSTFDGKNILDGANQIKLFIRNVDAPVRKFDWRKQ